MRLLICTQAVDKNDPILGFFHRWVIEFAKHFEHISVICLKEGTHTLPENVSVYSLGKEGGESWFKYISRFYKYLFLLRGTYDRVFVHMNPHYVMLGGVFWILARTPIFFWRNHARMNMMTRIAARFARLVFYTSPFACTSRYAHSRQMPVGIDTDMFTPGAQKKENTQSVKKVLFLGRLSPVKRAELFVGAGRYIGAEYELHLYGDDPEADQKYMHELRTLAPANVFFHSAIPNNETPAIYRTHDVYVNLTPEGSMDKAVLEAVACGTSVLVTNESFSHVVPPESRIKIVDEKALAERIVAIAHVPKNEEEKKKHASRAVVVADHSLEKLASMLYNYMK